MDKLEQIMQLMTKYYVEEVSIDGITVKKSIFPNNDFFTEEPKKKKEELEDEDLYYSAE